MRQVVDGLLKPADFRLPCRAAENVQDRHLLFAALEYVEASPHPARTQPATAHGAAGIGGA
jgi:hypothetical protein